MTLKQYVAICAASLVVLDWAALTHQPYRVWWVAGLFAITSQYALLWHVRVRRSR